MCLERLKVGADHGLHPRGTQRQYEHPISQFNVIFQTEEFPNIVPWLMLNHEGLDVLIHPLTDSSYDDHSKNALWIPRRYRCGSTCCARPTVLSCCPRRQPDKILLLPRTSGGGRIASQSASTIRQEPAGQCTGRPAVFEGDLAIDQDPVIAL